MGQLIREDRLNWREYDGSLSTLKEGFDDDGETMKQTDITNQSQCT